MPPVRCGKSWYLCVHMQRVKPVVDRDKVAAQQAFEPALGMHPVQRVAMAACRAATGKEPRDKIAQLGFVVGGERRLVRSSPKAYLLHTVEALRGVARPYTGKLEPVQQKRHLRPAANALFDGLPHDRRNQGEHPGTGFREPLQRGSLIRRMVESRQEVAAVGRVASFQLVGVFIEGI